MADHNEARELAERIITDTDANGSGADAPWARPLAAAYLEDRAKVCVLESGLATERRKLADARAVIGAQRPAIERLNAETLRLGAEVARLRGEIGKHASKMFALNREVEAERDAALQRAEAAEREAGELRDALTASRLTVSKMREALTEGYSLAWVHERLGDEALLTKGENDDDE